MTVPAKTNCLRYSYTADIATSTFDCIKCAVGYYVSGGDCLKRLSIITECSVYSDTLDQCQSCLTGFYLDTGSNLCVMNPTGIYGCIKYVELNICLICQYSMYPSGG